MPAKRGRPAKSKAGPAEPAHPVRPVHMDEDLQLARTIDESLAMNYVEDQDIDVNTLSLITQLREQERIEQEARDYALAKSLAERDQQYANANQQQNHFSQDDDDDTNSNTSEPILHKGLNISDDEIRQNIMKKQQYEQMRQQRIEQDAEYEAVLHQYENPNTNQNMTYSPNVTQSHVISEAEKLLKNINEKYNFEPKQDEPIAASADVIEDDKPPVPKSREELRKARMQWLNKMSQ